ncbi:MAG: alpha/beta fold hydrolase [Wenzhouxiangellaceae bacterium]|nr:alpha/beta fold hydrolase [Wenzhouxiangellaceae bacterium]
MTERPATLPPGLDPFAPRGWLANTHVQSTLTSSPWRKRRVLGRSADYRAAAQREVVDTGVGAHLLGYRSRPAAPNGALVVLLHGWEGSAESNYLLDTALALDAAGFETFRLNFRDHGDSHHLNEGLFHSCLLDEVLHAVARVADSHRDGPVFLAGFSLGGNFALRVARHAPSVGLALKRVVAVCPVIRPKNVLAALASGLPLYEKYFVRKWRRSLMRKQRLWPERYNLDSWMRHRTLAEQTRQLVADYTEFADTDAYLEGYSIAGDYLAGMETSCLMVTAADDPIIPHADFEALPRLATLELETWPHGGHCGFLRNWRLESWIEQRIVSELCQHLTPA